MHRIKLSKNFYLDEFTRSQVATRKGINNWPGVNSDIHSRLEALCLGILQPLRDQFGLITVTSGYRCPELNVAIGGSENSYHMSGHAADIVCAAASPVQLCQWIEKQGLPYDELINEFDGWCHVAIAKDPNNPKRKKLTAYKDANGVTRYARGITPTEWLKATTEQVYGGR